MCRPFFSALAGAVFTATGAFSVSADEYLTNIAISESVYFEDVDQRVLLETMAGKYCLAQSDLGDERDRVAMLSAMAHYTPPGQRGAAEEVIRTPASVRGHGPMPRPASGVGWGYLAHVYSAASTGAEAAEGGMREVLALTAILSEEEARLERANYGIEGATTRSSVRMVILDQVYGAHRLAGVVLAKELCALEAGLGDRERIAAAAQRFDLVTEAVLTGFEGAGVSAPPTEEIREELLGARAAWLDIRDAALSAGGTSDLGPDTVAEVSRVMDHVQRHLGRARALLGQGADEVS